MNRLWWVILLSLQMPVHAGLKVVDEQLTQVLPEFIRGDYRALVIGNSNYQDPKGRWQPLATAEADARAVADLLGTHYGFKDVRLLVNAGRREILVALSELSTRVKRNDFVLIYYAGHGYLDKASERGYWIPVDANGDDHTGYIRNSTLKEELSILGEKTRHTLLISDSCFSGALLRTASRSAAPEKPDDRYYEVVAQKKSVQILTAGGVEYVDDNYKTSGHSPFTYFLLNELRLNNTTLLTASELATRVKKAVANNVEQVPESGTLQGAGDELGEFIFVNININTTSPANTAGQKAVNESAQEQRAPAEVGQRLHKLIPLPMM